MQCRALSCAREVSALKENLGLGLSSNIAPMQSDVKEQKAEHKAGVFSRSTAIFKGSGYLLFLSGQIDVTRANHRECSKARLPRNGCQSTRQVKRQTKTILPLYSSRRFLMQGVDYLERLLGESAERHERHSQDLESALSLNYRIEI